MEVWFQHNLPKPYFECSDLDEFPFGLPEYMLKMFGFPIYKFVAETGFNEITIGFRELWNNVVGFAETEMSHGSEIRNSDIKQTTFAAIVENLKGENVKL